MPPLAAGNIFAGHRIEGEAGRGGMGVVYRATALRLKRTVALKVIAPELAAQEGFRERFEREMELAAQLEHPHIIPIYEAGEGPDGQLFVTMRFVGGTDLRELIANEEKLDPPLAARLINQVASALDEAHRKGMVHRDVKPANVLVSFSDGEARAYLTDFGLTKRISSTSGLTSTGTVVGTVDYIAPEQLEGVRVDARADVYALGCMLFHALTGVVPYPRDSDTAKMWAHVSAPVPSLQEVAPELPAALDDVVRRAMAKAPEERYSSAGDLGRAAVAAAGGAAVPRAEGTVATGPAAPDGATADTRPAERFARMRRRWILLLGSGAAALTAIAVASLLLTGSSHSSKVASRSGGAATAAGGPPYSTTIVPGRSIGPVAIGNSVAKTSQELGTPATFDASGPAYVWVVPDGHLYAEVPRRGGAPYDLYTDSSLFTLNGVKLSDNPRKIRAALPAWSQHQCPTYRTLTSPEGSTQLIFPTRPKSRYFLQVLISSYRDDIATITRCG